MRIKFEKSDDNDTSAGREYGGRALARDMLQRDRVPGDCKVSPTYSVPHRWRVNENAYLCILRYTGKEREIVRQVCCVGLLFMTIESLWNADSIVEKLYRIKPYRSRKVLHMLEKEYWTGDHKYIFCRKQL